MTSITFKITLLIVVIIESIYSNRLSAQEKLQNGIKNDKITKLLEEKLTVFPNNTEISIALIHNEKSEFFGILRKNDSLEIKSNQNAIFEIGSITKVFTSTLLSELVIAKEISLDDPVISLLPFELDNLSENQSNITLKMLANHTSGLPRLPENIMPLLALDQSDPYRSYNADKLYEYLKTDFETITPAGTKSAYSNIGAGFLGHLLTLKTKTSYEELLQQKIFKPLGMNNSTTILKNIPKHNLVKGLDPKGQEVSNWNFDVLAGAGAIKSNITDIEKFVRKHMDTSPVYDLTQQVTHTENKQLSMGLGWHIINKGNQSILFHNGGTGGYRSCIVINKETQKAVIMLSNISAFHPKNQRIDSLCFKILNLIN